ncbi:MAG: transposase [Planctomycetota bacterium]
MLRCNNHWFVTFSCCRRRRLVDPARARQVAIGLLAKELATHEGICRRFVVMPDHVSTPSCGSPSRAD